MASESKSGGPAAAAPAPAADGNSNASEQNAVDKCYAWFVRTRVGSALSREYSFFFNFFFAQLLWWAIAFPRLIDHGYENDIANGSEPHGSEGSGIVPIALFLVVVASVLFLVRFVRNLIEGVPLTAAELITQQITRQNTNAASTEKERATVVP